MKFKRLLSSFLCAVMLVGTLTVPALAATSTDASGNTIYISDNSLNNEVRPLSEAPEMDYTFTFNDIEFSNYIKYEPTYTLDAQNNRIFVARITIGLGGAMKSNKGDVEFMAYPHIARTVYAPSDFNAVPTYLSEYGPDSDLVAYKTNTPYMAKKNGTYSYLSDLYITPYSDSDRAEDGTWDAGLTWEFNKNPAKVRENASYLDIFYIRVDHGTKVSYFEVRVTDDTTFYGDRTTTSESKPVENAPASAVKSYKVEDTYYPWYGFKANSDFVTIDADSVVKGEKASVGNLTSETMQSFPRSVDTYTTKGKTELTMNTNIPFNYIFVYYAYSWDDLRADNKTVISSNGSNGGKTTYTLDKSGVYAVEMMFAEIPAKCTFVVEVSNGGTTQTPTTPALKSFKDVAANRWSHDAIMEMVDLGMFSGTTTPDANGVGTFNPTGTMTRAQYIVVVTRYLYGKELDGMEQGAYWYSNNYDLAVKHGLITKSEFSIDTINNPITRQEMALVAVRTAQAQGETMPTLVGTDRIADYATVGNYYKDFVVKAFSMGLISGYDDKGTFGPNDTLTREQGAMVAYRLVKPDTRNLPET